MSRAASGAGDTPLPGCDPAGEVFLNGDRVLRGIFPEHADHVREVLHLCARHDLFHAGLVRTWEVPTPKLLDRGYALVLEHERVPRITYPHEWPASMLREAALFLLEFARTLASVGITLKDWHPYNVLFRGPAPVFVDFTSLVPTTALRDEPYLQPPTPPRIGRLLWDKDAVYLYEVYRRTFVPYYLHPLRMMEAGRYADARRRLEATALNTTREVITEQEVFSGRPVAALRARLGEFRRYVALVEHSPGKERFLLRLAGDIEAMAVTPPASGYADYYLAKGEDVPFSNPSCWPDKARKVNEVLTRFTPETLLDLGCNTGWYSILAARAGCSVTSIDRDEHCVDALWHTAQRDGLDILPLVLDLTALPSPRFPLDWRYTEGLREDRRAGPLYREPADRLGAEMVLALAIVHHLVLGRGWTMAQVVDSLAVFAHRTLLVEFVGIADALVAAETSFFPAWAAEPARFKFYTLERFIAELRRHFSVVEAQPLTPSTRTLLTCTR